MNRAHVAFLLAQADDVVARQPLTDVVDLIRQLAERVRWYEAKEQQHGQYRQRAGQTSRDGHHVGARGRTPKRIR